MFDLIKLALLAAGCVVIYGLTTGADLNELFVTVSDNLLPAIKDMASGIVSFIKEQMK